MRITRTTAMVIALLAGAALALAQQHAPPPQTQAEPPPRPGSVADAARKSKAEKDKAKSKKVYTDEDMPSLSGAVSVVGDKSASTPSGDAKGPDANPAGEQSTKGGKSDEAMWRARAKKIRDQMDAVDQEIAKTEDEIKKSGGAGFDPQSGLKQNVIYFEDRNAKLKDLQNKKAELQKQMDALEDEARKAGVPAGWLR